MQLMEGALPEHYNKLHKTYANVKDSLNDPDDDMKSILRENGDKESESVEEQKMDDHLQQKQMDKKDVDQVEEKREKRGKYQILLVEE